METNSLLTPQLEPSHFTLAENLSLCFQIIHLPVLHSSWQLRKDIFKSHFVFKTQLLKKNVHNIGKQAPCLDL